MKYLLALSALLSMSAQAAVKNDNGAQPKQTLSQGDQFLSCASCAATAPAAIKLNRDWNASAGVSYLYWYAAEDGLDLATTAAFNTGSNLVVSSVSEEKVIFQDFSYSSGFKAEMALNHGSDQWVWKFGYTWLNPNTTRKASAPTVPGETEIVYFTNWFNQSVTSQSLAAEGLSSQWHLNLNWFDLTVGRPFYSGTQFTMSPFAGLRGTYLTQHLTMTALTALNVSSLVHAIASHNSLSSWGVGPRAGVEGRFLLGCGVRLQAEAGGSLLYTHYTKVKHFEDSFLLNGTRVSYAMKNVGTVRPMFEGNLGLGWGSYSEDKTYHFDVSATYDFNYLWNQNMMRWMNDVFTQGIGAAANDLYFQGLTINAAFNY